MLPYGFEKVVTCFSPHPNPEKCDNAQNLFFIHEVPNWNSFSKAHVDKTSHLS